MAQYSAMLYNFVNKLSFLIVLSTLKVYLVRTFSATFKTWLHHEVVDAENKWLN